MINTTNISEVRTIHEKLHVKDLCTLYETSNSEPSPTKRQIIQGLLKQARDMDRDMIVNAKIVRVIEDFH